MNLQTKLFMSGVRNAELILSHDVYFDDIAYDILKQLINADCKSKKINSDTIHLFHKNLNDALNFCISSGHLSFWPTPGLIYKINADNYFYQNKEPALQTMEINPPLESIAFTGIFSWENKSDDLSWLENIE